MTDIQSQAPPIAPRPYMISSRAAGPNRYLGLRVRLLLVLLRRRKLTFRKLLNVAHCYLAYLLRTERSAPTPMLINFELWNECNESCVFCRSKDDLIYDQNPSRAGHVIPKGKMAFETFERIIDQTKSRTVMAIPYVNGEPLLSKDIYRAIEAATAAGVGTLIATNGVLLNERNSRRLLEAGLDLIKVHVSGFSQAVHGIEHRRGDVERIKAELQRLVQIKKEYKSATLILLDYILYNHNRHELELARRFADELGILFNVRPGNNKGLEDTEPANVSGPLPVDVPCVWLWTALTVDWNGAVYPCCDHVVWGGAESYSTYEPSTSDIGEIWNGARSRWMRKVHARDGRTPIQICAQCPRTGTAFKF
jgi:MoaA/NifB/PqqE/SkfB family radical SAM enzyme